MLSMRDDEFYIDKVDYKHLLTEQSFKKNKDNDRIVSYGGNSESSEAEDDGTHTHRQ